MAQEGKPLAKIAEAFKDLSATVNSGTQDVKLVEFSRACSLISPLFGCLGITFKFAEMDFVADVHGLAEASKSIESLQSLLDRDTENDCVKKDGSHSRNLLKVKRGIDMVRVLFQQILASKGNSLKVPASVAYAKVLAPHHGRAIRTVVAAGMLALPTKARLLQKLNENEASARVQMQ
ncbi:accelerated cell death 11-like [Telopea speciosissima]|uniref:accelerated cell death 11-like n=1 Tax=Telopea speciosissima TaxID=54955 RepID=UPI001CC602D9|nr:accelerated cell death 11-like [Telopea speciosissima]